MNVKFNLPSHKLPIEVRDLMADPEIIAAFQDLQDQLREKAEEMTMDLRKRKAIVRGAIHHLSNKYW